MSRRRLRKFPKSALCTPAEREPDPGEEPWEDTSVLAPDEPPLKLSVQPQADTQANLSPGNLSSGKASSAKTSSAKASHI